MAESQDQSKKLGELLGRAWGDGTFKARLLSDTIAVLKENGITIPEDVSVKAIENTDKVIHIVIPRRNYTVPVALRELISRAWSDDAFKARLLSDTIAVLKENGITVPENVSVKAIENTDKVIHIVIPPKAGSSTKSYVLTSLYSPRIDEYLL